MLIYMYTYEIKEKLVKRLKKIALKDSTRFNDISKKIIQIADNPMLGKPLSNVLKGKRRVHIGPYVLIYEILKNEHKIVFLEIAHHDDAYK